MAWVWGALAWLEPAFKTVTDASDPAVSALMKIPAILADVAIAAGIAIRMLVWPARGFVGDLDQFVLWVHGIAVDGWTRAYDQNLSFPAVMAWVWGALALLEPAFRTVTDASDPAISALMKLPASLADLGIAVAVGWWFRDKPWAAVAAMGAVLLWPATWYVSAWWGQYEPIYVLTAVLAVLAARSGRPSLVAALVALSLMTKPQALPLIVPFAAWFLATQGWQGSIKGALVGLLVFILVWLPFMPAGGPGNYLGNVAEYQDGIFNVLSLRAWNPWWVVQELAAGGDFVLDSTAVLGPVTFRQIGFLVAGLLSLVVFAGVYRRPSPHGLALGLAAITLVAFVSLTTMHERYVYPAFVFLLMAANSRLLLVTWVAFAVAFAANLVWAAPAPELSLPDLGAATLVGSGIITLVAVIALLWTGRSEPHVYDDVGQPLHSLWPTTR
jgi:hypothetical protein